VDTDGAPSRAEIVCSTVLPMAVICAEDRGGALSGARSPERESSTAGMPRAPNGACSERVSGNARCTNCPKMLVPPGLIAACAESAAATVLRSIGGATS